GKNEPGAAILERVEHQHGGEGQKTKQSQRIHGSPRRESTVRRGRLAAELCPSSSFSSRSTWRRQSRAWRVSSRATRRHLPWPSRVARPPPIRPTANAPSSSRKSGACSEKLGSAPPKGSRTSSTGLRLTTA